MILLTDTPVTALNSTDEHRPIHSSKSPYRHSYPDTKSKNQIHLHLSVPSRAEIKNDGRVRE